MTDARYRPFTPAERQQTLDDLLAALRTDDRLAGVVIVGSAAEGFLDTFSDIDLAVVVARPEDVRPAFDDWGARLGTVRPVLHQLVSPRGGNVWLYAVLFAGFLELDVSFQSIDDLTARRARWRVAWERPDLAGRLEATQRATWAARRDPDRVAVLCHHLGAIWHYTIHVQVAIQRGQLWRATADLATIRDYTVELAGLRLGLETNRYRDVDDLPADLRAALVATLPTALDAAALNRALRAAVAVFFCEARVHEESLGLALTAPYVESMGTYLAQWGDPLS